MITPTSLNHPSLFDTFQDIPAGLPVALLLRHAEREAIPDGTVGNDVAITRAGKDQTLALGLAFSRHLGSLHSSPILRCIQTAIALRTGAGLQTEISVSRLLGDPGAYVLNGAIAWKNWEALGNAGVIRHLATQDSALSGMVAPNKAVENILDFLFSRIAGVGGLHVFITHDVIIAPTVARLLKRAYDPSDDPAYLEGAFFWRHPQSGLQTAYRNTRRTITLIPAR